ncbi:MAG: hypothetical protein ACI8ZM_003734 [Crocinitomix sp.]|jgi:hypothetical protein
MRIILIVLTTLFTLIGFGQSNVIGLIPFKVEKTTETWTNRLEPKFTGGLYYNRYFEKLHWSTELIIAKNSINDYCKNCNASGLGRGVYKEMSIATGLGLRLHGEKHSGLIGNVRLLIYGALTSYTGTFLHMNLPWYFDHDSRFYLLGGQLQYSLTYTLDSGVLFGVDIALKQSKTWVRAGGFSSIFSNTPSFVSMMTLPSVRVGYQF